MRNPRSEFTFINYLHQKKRLVEFANLNTFLPARVEYEDYMKWCASWFEEVVSYSQEVIAVNPQRSSNGDISVFEVVTKNHLTNKIETRRTRHVVIAAGGRPNITAPFPQNHPKVVHSSKFSYMSKQILKDHQAPYKIAIVGNGQSAAEIFDFLHANYPNSQTRLLIKGGALRPSDDSPLYVISASPQNLPSMTNSFQRQRDLQPIAHRSHISPRSRPPRPDSHRGQGHKLRCCTHRPSGTHIRDALPSAHQAWQFARG